jgi:hypothetical protein
MPNDWTGQHTTGPATPTAFIPDEAESLLQELGDSHSKWATGAARYGPGGTFDALRKRYLAVRSMQLRDTFAGKGEKVTESRLDEMAHGDDEYGTWLDQETSSRATWLTLDAERDSIKTRLKFLNYNPVR